MKAMQMRSALAVTSAIVILCGCGGGGSDATPQGGSSVTATTLTFPLRTPYETVTLQNLQHTYSLAGTIDSISVIGSGTLTNSYRADGLFIKPAGGVAYDPQRDNVYAQEVTSTNVGNVGTPGSSQINAQVNAKTLSYFNAQNQLIVIVTDQSAQGVYPSPNREYIFVDNYQPPPDRIKLGDSGQFFSSTMQNLHVNTLVTCGSVSVTWDTSPDTATSLFFRVTTSYVRPAPPWDCPKYSSATVVTRYRLSGSGLALVDQSQTSGSQSFTATVN